MKLKCLGDRLAGASSIARMVVPRSPALPVLTYVEIEAKDGRAYLRATDLEKMVVVDLFAAVEEEGKVLIPLKKLRKFVKHEKGTVVIESKDCGVWLSDADGQVKVYIETLPPTDELPRIECGETEYDVGEEFVLNLKRAWPFSAEEEPRPVLGAVLVESLGEGKVFFAAADGFRLFTSSMNLSLPAGSWLLPRSTCAILAGIMKKKQAVKMGCDSGKMWFEVEPDVKFVSQLIQGNFPVYRMLIPTAPPVWTFTVSGPLLQSRVLQFQSTIVRLTKTEDGFLKLAMADDDDSFEAQLPAEMTGDGKIALNPMYLADVAKLFAELTVEVTAFSAPVRIHGDLAGVVIVVMPMFVQW